MNLHVDDVEVQPRHDQLTAKIPQTVIKPYNTSTHQHINIYESRVFKFLPILKCVATQALSDFARTCMIVPSYACTSLIMRYCHVFQSRVKSIPKIPLMFDFFFDYG